jgi:hypothetical protein
MKTILVTTISIILILIMGWRPNEETLEHQVEVQIEQSKIIQDSAIMYLKELHDKNDSLLDVYFKK